MHNISLQSEWVKNNLQCMRTLHYSCRAPSKKMDQEKINISISSVRLHSRVMNFSLSKREREKVSCLFIFHTLDISLSTKSAESTIERARDGKEEKSNFSTKRQKVIKTLR
jgi:hypothetical protein